MSRTKVRSVFAFAVKQRSGAGPHHDKRERRIAREVRAELRAARGRS